MNWRLMKGQKQLKCVFFLFVPYSLVRWKDVVDTFQNLLILYMSAYLVHLEELVLPVLHILHS